MSELDARLSRLFRATFPALKIQDLHQATRDSIAEWDSIAAVTLLSLVEEEFGQQFDPQDAAEWISYQQIREALRERVRA
jgi:acyl carrier protein